MGIAKNSFYDFTSKTTILCFSVVCSIIVAKTLGAVDRGVFVTILFVNTFIGNLAHCSIATANKYFIGKDASRLGSLHTNSILSILFLCGVTYAILLFFQSPLRHLFLKDISVRNLIIAVSLLPFTLYYVVFVGMMIGLGSIRTLSIVNVVYFCVPQTMFVVLLAIYAPGGDKTAMVNALIAGWAVFQVIATAGLFALVRASGGRLKKPDLKVIRRMFSFGLRAHVGTFAGTFLRRNDLLMIRASYESSGAFGIYQLAESWAEKIFQVGSAMESGAFRPVAAGGSEDIVRLVPRLVRTTLCLAFTFGVVIMMGTALAVLLILDEYAAMVVPLVILVFGYTFMCGSRMFAVYFTGHLGKPQIPSSVNWITLAVNVPLVIVLVTKFGMTGAACATAGSYIFMFWCFFYLFKKRARAIRMREFFIPQKRDIEAFKTMVEQILKRSG